MKYEITADDIKLMERDMLTNRTLKHLKHVSFYKFTVGDVLIREDLYGHTGSEQWKPKMAECGLPYKYVYVFENELGVGYIRRLSVNGRKFVESPVCVLEFDPAQTRFVTDPEYADHIIFSQDGEEFDAKSRYDEIKRKREAMNRKNKKLRVPIKDETEAENFLKQLTVGQQFWLGNGQKDPNIVTEAYKLDQHSWGGPRGFVAYKTPNYHRDSHLYGNSLIYGPVYLTRPFFFDELPA